MIHARSSHPAFGLGSFTDLGGSNPSVLSYVREHTERGDERRHRLRQQPVPLPAAGRARPAPLGGRDPVELLGGVPFPPIGELPIC